MGRHCWIVSIRKFTLISFAVIRIIDYSYNEPRKQYEPIVSTDRKIFTRSLICYELKYKSLLAVVHCSSHGVTIAPELCRVVLCVCMPQVRWVCTVLLHAARMLCYTGLLLRIVAFIKPEDFSKCILFIDSTSQNTRLLSSKAHSVSSRQESDIGLF